MTFVTTLLIASLTAVVTWLLCRRLYQHQLKFQAQQLAHYDKIIDAKEQELATLIASHNVDTIDINELVDDYLQMKAQAL